MSEKSQLELWRSCQLSISLSSMSARGNSHDKQAAAETEGDPFLVKLKLNSMQRLSRASNMVTQCTGSSMAVIDLSQSQCLRTCPVKTFHDCVARFGDVDVMPTETDSGCLPHTGEPSKLDSARDCQRAFKVKPMLGPLNLMVDMVSNLTQSYKLFRPRQ